MGSDPTFDCKTHGRQAWRGHLQCKKCGAAFSTKDPDASTHAAVRCRACGVRFLPAESIKDRALAPKFSAIPCCSMCFDEAPGGTIQKEHESGSPFCLGEQCKFHGPMIRKLKKRAEASLHKKIVELVDGDWRKHPEIVHVVVKLVRGPSDDMPSLIPVSDFENTSSNVVGDTLQVGAIITGMSVRGGRVSLTVGSNAFVLDDGSETELDVPLYIERGRSIAATVSSGTWGSSIELTLHGFELNEQMLDNLRAVERRRGAA
jgi:DNA-directed RNA polymerase subunit RPC12/RpoP